MTREQFENNTNWKMSYEELIYEEIQKYTCIHFYKKDCLHHKVKISRHIDEYLALMAV